MCGWEASGERTRLQGEGPIRRLDARSGLLDGDGNVPCSTLIVLLNVSFLAQGGDGRYQGTHHALFLDGSRTYAWDACFGVEYGSGRGGGWSAVDDERDAVGGGGRGGYSVGVGVISGHSGVELALLATGYCWGWREGCGGERGVEYGRCEVGRFELEGGGYWGGPGGCWAGLGCWAGVSTCCCCCRPGRADAGGGDVCGGAGGGGGCRWWVCGCGWRGLGEGCLSFCEFLEFFLLA